LIDFIILLYIKFRKPQRLKFGEWADREAVATSIAKLGDRDTKNFSALAIRYVSLSLHIPEWWIAKLGWTKAISLFFVSQNYHSPKKIPLLSGEEKDDKKIGWDYDGRNVPYWIHILASTYSWSVEYIRGLEVDTALALMQEILVNEQLKKEFQWSMSEIAYQYNPSSKKSEFKALPRPNYMQEKAKEIKLVKLPKALMPMGHIVDMSGMVKVMDERIAQKQVESE
jgi:hypothetical protein